ncbi:MAG TPA: vWA domain-containing protein [Kofleriaceae bacterium]|nr:vWA domain-containing protein [Kofleriaceae bacterium]
MIRLAAVSSVLALTLAAGCGGSLGDGQVGDDDQGSGSNGGGGGGGGADASCPGISFMATQVIPSIQLLIDRSGSMGTNLPNTNTSRYQAMHDALVGTNGVVGQLQAKAHFGASLFTSDSPCPRLYNTTNRQLNNFTQVKNLIESQSPNGNTPTPGAIDQTVALFQANPPPMGSPPIIVLATDGLPNSCAGTDSQPESIQAAANAYGAGIRTFILGIAGVNDSFLQSMANAGQGVQPNQPNAKYYTANSPAELQMAFQQIIGGVVSCELTINGTVDPDQAKGGTVMLNGMQLTYGTDWEVVNGTTIRLLGSACDTLKGSTNPQVQATFPCGSVIL